MRGSLVATIVVAGLAGGCAGVDSPGKPGGVVCTTQYVYGLSVTVRDKASGQRVCDAEVVATSGSHRETLSRFGPADGCTYSGAGERPGVYELRATREGFRPATLAGVAVGADECHVIPVAVAVELER